MPVSSKTFCSSMLLGALALGATRARPAHAESAAIDDRAAEMGRLGARGADVQRIIDRAARDGLPTAGLTSKVREGLAKGVSPELIAGAVERMAEGLGEANRWLRGQRGRAVPAVVRALAEAHAVGVAWEAAQSLVASGADETRLAQAIDVLAELASRGYPDRRAALLVREVVERDPASIGRLVGGLESIRRGQTVSRADALEALGRNLNGNGVTLEVAVNRSLEGREHANSAGGGDRNPHANDHAAAAASKKGMGNGQGNMK